MSSGITFTDKRGAIEYAASMEEEGIHVEVSRNGKGTWKAVITKKVRPEHKVVIAERYERIGATAGVADPTTGIITVRKSTNTPDVIAHEEYHLRYGKPEYFTEPKAFVKEELEAELYAYLKTGKPQSIIRMLRGIHVNLIVPQGNYKICPSKAEKLIRLELEKLDVPRQWLTEMTKHEEELIEIYKGRLPTEEEWNKRIKETEEGNG